MHASTKALILQHTQVSTSSTREGRRAADALKEYLNGLVTAGKLTNAECREIDDLSGAIMAVWSQDGLSEGFDACKRAMIDLLTNH